MTQKNLSIIFDSTRSIGNGSIYQPKITSGSNIGAKQFKSYRQRIASNYYKQKIIIHQEIDMKGALKQSKLYPNHHDKILTEKSKRKPQKRRRHTYLQNLDIMYSNQIKKEQKKVSVLSTMLKEMPKLRETGSTVCHSPKASNILNSHSKKVEDFKKIKKLGSGKFGEVYLVKHKKTGFIAALKVICKHNLMNGNTQQNKKALNQLISQIKIQAFLSHPNLIKLYDFFSNQNNVYLLLELAGDGHLFDLLERHNSLSEQTTSIITREIVQGLKYMHKKGIIHRDLKLENIVLSHGMAKICDFGWSVHSPAEFRSTLCGTPLYLSPEILLGRQYNKKIDSWAIGALCHELSTGQNAFKIKRKDDLSKIVTEDFEMQKGSIELRSFLTFILRKNPDKRPDTQTLMKHPFIQKYKDLQTSEELCHLTSLKFIK